MAQTSIALEPSSISFPCAEPAFFPFDSRSSEDLEAWPLSDLSQQALNHAASPAAHAVQQGGQIRSHFHWQLQTWSLQVENLTSPNVENDQMHAGKGCLRISLKEDNNNNNNNSQDNLT